MTKEQLLDSINFDNTFSLEFNDGCSVSYGDLARRLYEDVNWFFEEQEGIYNGDWYMVGKKGDDYYFFSMSYGSCSGCDWLEAAISHRDKEQRRYLLGEIVDEILNMPILHGKENALEYAKKFDWQNLYDRDEHNPLVNEVIKAIEETVKS